MTKSLVFDLGAGSGRAMMAIYDGKNLNLSEVSRFSGIETHMPDGPHWDLARLFDEIKTGLKQAFEKYGAFDSIGIDSWGVDYTLIDGDGGLDLSPFHYRHPRSQSGYDRFPVTDESMFLRTGSQILPVNTAYQLLSGLDQARGKLTANHRLVLIADAVNFFLTGHIASEITLARTTGMLGLSGEWDHSICTEAGIPHTLLPPVVSSGQVLGCINDSLHAELGIGPVPVISVAAHDTASAVCALPLRSQEAFLICGSWAILGSELDHPVTSDEARLAGFGNEGGVEGRQIFLKSLNGLHLLQKLRSSWSSKTCEEVSFAHMSSFAAAAATDVNVAAVDLSDAMFFNPADIIETIRSACPAIVPDMSNELGYLALVVYRGLVNGVSDSLTAMEKLTGKTVNRIRICGGGGHDAFLCQLIANVTGRAVSVGPIEASAWGNAMLQLIGLGKVDNLEAARMLVEKSTDIRDYYPQN
ncbi:rhamnulokinase [Ochrobactrum soli]|uniref:Rhamnulokinase n=1 Tax=Ochrobactrum soli TaxID=2448455 RepID=A0A849KVC3_9HYPH|nr:FGGY-family carbohydrate kinase [[Ochrobactrum] soli]NNU62859.1 hypothetical protein [[Ochrobactrum] soli]